MGVLMLTWFAVSLFALFIVWGMDVRLTHRPRVVFWFAGFVLIFNLFAQTAFFQSEKGLTQALDGGPIVQQTADELKDVLARYAMQPGELRNAASIDQWAKVLSSSMIHYGWIPLFFNLWVILLFGHVLEGFLGWMRFVPILLIGLIAPALLEGLLPPIVGASAGHYYGGISGVVYALIGAGLIVFPRGRCMVAINYDGRFWAFTLCVLLPITFFSARAGLPITEMIILVGTVGFFLILQPFCGQIIAPVWAIALCKLAQDLLLMEPIKHDILANSIWRIGGGLLLGAAMGLMLDGARGFQRSWHDALSPTKKRGKGKRPQLNQLEAAAQTNADSARRYLGQKVFIADAERAIPFYRDVVMPQYSDLTLPITEQMALARMLHSKGHIPEALHAYENLLRNYEIDENHWIIWLTTAELLKKTKPRRRTELRLYLDKFLQGKDNMMRDRLEAEQMLRELDEADSTEEQGQPDEPDTAESPPSTDSPAAKSSDESKQPDHTEIVAAAEDIAPPGKESESDASIQLPTVDFPRLTPRTFAVKDGQPTRSAIRKHTRHAGELAPDDLAKIYWNPLEVQSSDKLTDERLLAIKSRSSHTKPIEELSGNYNIEDPRKRENFAQRSKGTMAHIEAIKTDFRLPENDTTNTDPLSADRNSDTAPGLPSNYGTEKLSNPEERPRIRLRNERKDK